jgi:hypothetical protein
MEKKRKKQVDEFERQRIKRDEDYKRAADKIKNEGVQKKVDHAKSLGEWKNRGFKRANNLCGNKSTVPLCEKKDILSKRLQYWDKETWKTVLKGIREIKQKTNIEDDQKYEEIDKFLSKTRHESMIKKETHGHKSPISNILKTLVKTIGKNSPGAKKGPEDLQRLLKKYPNEVPSAIIRIITNKIRAHGLGLIFGVQAASAIAGLLVSIIPIPGMGIIGEGFSLTGDGLEDAITALHPDSIFKMLSGYEEKIFKILEKYGTLISGMLSGISCCSKDKGDLNKNLDNFGTIVSELIKDVDENKEADVKKTVKKIRTFMKKTTEEKIDTKELTKLAEEIKSEKEKRSTTNPKDGPQGGGKRRSRRGKRIYNKHSRKKNKRTKKRRKKSRKTRRKTRRKKV